MIKSKLLILLLIISANTSFSQKCNCLKNFEWVKKTFEENDAGFQYALDIKGLQAYEIHNKLISEKVMQTGQISDCANLLTDWLAFFRSGHITIRQLKYGKSVQKTKKVIAEIPANNLEVINITSTELEHYLNGKKERDFEGIWSVEPYKIGIKKIGQFYVGFILETTAENWKLGEVKFKFNDTLGTFYLRNKSVEKFSVTKEIGINFLQLGKFRLKRLYPIYETEKLVDIYFKSISAQEPFIEELNATTLLFRIPSFRYSQKKIIDSIIVANKSKILATENLIIDLRNNGGGSDDSYYEIIPFLYTNPIKEIGVELLSTKLNNKRMLRYINDSELDYESKEWAKKSYDKLQKQLGSFVNLDSSKVRVQILDTIYPNPQNIGIVINKGNASTTEQFLLAAKQSAKVKLFGAKTLGVLDISNMNFVESPSGEFELGYCISKSFRIPNMTIDGKGIQPDYDLDAQIEEYKWLEYVTNILSEK